MPVITVNLFELFNQIRPIHFLNIRTYLNSVKNIQTTSQRMQEEILIKIQKFVTLF